MPISRRVLGQIKRESRPPPSQTRVSPRDGARATRLKRYRPGELVGIDCFFVGRLYGGKGPVWQITAIDTYSSFAWADLVVTPPAGPTVGQTSGARPPRRLRAPGLWLAARARPHRQRRRVRPTGIRLPTAAWRLPHPDPLRRAPDQRPRRTAPRTILAECWRPAFARFLQVRCAATTRPPPLPQRLQLRPRPPRTKDGRAMPGRARLRCPQDGAEMSRTCRHNSESVQPEAGPSIGAGLALPAPRGSRPRWFRRPHG